MQGLIVWSLFEDRQSSGCTDIGTRELKRTEVDAYDDLSYLCHELCAEVCDTFLWRWEVFVFWNQAERKERQPYIHSSPARQRTECP